MTVTEHDTHAEGGHHESPQHKHKKEHIAIWLFIAGDAVFLMLELFAWFYLRTLNTNGGWRFTQCTKALSDQISGTLVGTPAFNSNAQTCTDGLGNPITHQIATAAPIHTIAIAVLMLISAAFIWFAEVQARQGATRKTTTPLAGFALLFVIGAIVWQIVQFQVLPFTTIDGTYASLFEFYMGANLAHFALILIIAQGMLFRSRAGKFENGNWYQLHLSRLFWVWVAASSALLALVTIFFA